MSRKRKIFSAEFKSKVVLEVLTTEQMVAQIASKYEIIPIILYWMPHIKVIEPNELDDAVRERIKEY